MSIMRRHLSLYVIVPFLLTLVVGCEQAQEAETDDRPNIIFIFTDDHALQAISAYGSVINQTPNIDRLAQEGMLFENALVTNSICAPSRAVILTGKHSHLNGVMDNGNVFDSTQVTFPKLLQQAGYETAMIGKWHLKTQPTGFDYWRVLPGQGHYYNPDFRTPNGVERVEGYVTDLITEDALDWLQNRRAGDKPFMAMVQHKAPHREWSPGPAHLTTYDDGDIPEPPSLFDDYANRASGAANQEMEIDRHMGLHYDLKVRQMEDSTLGWLHRAALHNYARMTDEQRTAWDAAYEPKNEAFMAANLSGDDLVRWKYQRYIKDYLRTIASVDDGIGQILDYLDTSGLSENTIVIYSSDQGFYLGEHGWYDKRWMYEESLHMPFIARWPGHTAPGSVNTDLVQNLDFAETFLEVAGAPIPDDMQGHSLVPLLEGQTPADWRSSIYYHYYESQGPHRVAKHIGVRNDRYKLIFYYELDEWEFFDLETDPQELNSAYDQPEHTERIAEMKAELARLQAFYQDDTVPTWES